MRPVIERMTRTTMGLGESETTMTYGRRLYLTQQILVRLAYAGPTTDEAREFLKASARFVVATTLVFLALCAIATGAELPQQVTPPVSSDSGVSPDRCTSGEFLYRTEGRSPFATAPSVQTRVRFDITGVIARAVVTQTFRNPLDQWIEGVYVFPLPESAAVDHLKMKVGSRVIEGQIREKEQARREFQKAAEEGKRASLVEQQRPNLFTSRVANLGPLEEMEVEIEYQQTLEVEEGRVALRFPLAMTPRYMPAIEESFVRLTSGGSRVIPANFDLEEGQENSADGGPRVSPTWFDQSLVQPPFLPASVKGNPVSIEVHLNAGFEVASLESRTHPLAVETVSGREYTAHLRDELVPSDRDFQLEWRPTPGVMPQSSVTREKGPDGTYALVSLFPPVGAAARSASLPREVTFIVDTSGSMEGVSMQQAKRALEFAIGRLSNEDSFNVIQFNSFTSQLFDAPVPANESNRARATAYARSLQASGGTEMLPALNAALVDRTAAATEGRLRQVLFLTDGAVSNEDQLFGVIKQRLGRARLFTVGIGSAPNSHFMSKAAEFGRGTFTFISDVNTVEKQMNELFQKVESPVLSDIRIAFEGLDANEAEIWPSRVPDLYLGEPVVVSARFSRNPETIRVTGQLDGQAFETRVPLNDAREGHGINVLWANRKVQSLLEGVYEGEDPEAIREKVVEVGLTHHLVTRHTSLVAVDVTPVRPEDATLESVDVPVNLPHGSPFGTLPQSGTPMRLFMIQAFATMLTAGVLFMMAKRS